MSIRCKHEKWLSLALEVSKDSTCLRRQYGAVIVKNDRLISTGYNGAARGCTECTDTGICYRIENNIPHGKEYESCQSVHAEMNALLLGDWDRTQDAILFLAGTEDGEEILNPSCCIMCERCCRNAGIKCVVTRTEVFYFNKGNNVTKYKISELRGDDNELLFE